MRLAALYSGGKDSTYAVYLAQQAGLEVTDLLTVLPQDASMMYQVPNVAWAGLSAEALGISHRTVQSAAGGEAELRAMTRGLDKTDVEGVVVGAVASDYQFVRVHQVCEALGLWVYAPLWRKDPRALLREYVDAGFAILIVAVAAEGLDAEWLGRTLDQDALRDLAKLHRTFGVHPTGEGGEFETWVTDGPNYGARIRVQEAVKRWEGTSGTYEVRKATLES
ncbi:MAG: diphthine--ammonia ligase [Candidatus Thermoplasmatota archaeon]|nr:diphthine--ammonia ligase [Candidatus Thermoplasmatota archaeon]